MVPSIWSARAIPACRSKRLDNSAGWKAEIQREHAIREQALHERATAATLEGEAQRYKRESIRAAQAAETAVQQRDAARRSSREHSWRLEQQLVNH